MKPTALLALAAAIALAGCTQPESSQFTTMPPQGWPYEMHLLFVPQPADSDSVAVADIAVAVRHANTYEYSNIYVELQYATPDSLVTDTANIVLADDYGHWHGTGVGVGYQVVDTLVRRVPLVLSQPIRLRHIMRADTLAAIEQAGIIIAEAQLR